MITPQRYTTPKLHDYIVDAIQTALEALNWIEYVFPVVREGTKAGQKYPQAYLNDGQVSAQVITPDEKVKSWSFFTLDNVDRVDEESDFSIYTLSLTVWLQLNKTHPEKEYDHTAERIDDIIGVLEAQHCYNIVYTTRFEEVFEGFTMITDNADKYNRHNFSAFKLTFRADHANV
jgi:hypothetical protein